MNNAKALFCLILVALLIFPSNVLFAGPNYSVEPGDILNIDIALRGSLADLSKLSVGLSLKIIGESVYSHHEVMVAPDGFISLAGLSSSLRVSGLTLQQIRETVTAELHLPPERNLVSVSLARTNSMAFFVLGEVKQPGRFTMEHPTYFAEAIAYAGGPTDKARLNKIMLLRDGRPSVLLNLSPKHLKVAGYPAIPIKPSDTIFVPRKWIPDSFAVLVFLTAVSTLTSVYVATK